MKKCVSHVVRILGILAVVSAPFVGVHAEESITVACPGPATLDPFGSKSIHFAVGAKLAPNLARNDPYKTLVEEASVVRAVSSKNLQIGDVMTCIQKQIASRYVEHLQKNNIRICTAQSSKTEECMRGGVEVWISANPEEVQRKVKAFSSMAIRNSLGSTGGFKFADTVTLN